MRELKLVIVCMLLFMSCKSQNTNTSILNIENDAYKIEIKKVNRNDFSKFTNSFTTSPFLAMNAECISLEEFIGRLKSMDAVPVIMKNKNLDDQYYSVFISQNYIDSVQESKVKRIIVKALGLKIEEKIFKIDTTVVAMHSKNKFMKHANIVVSDTIKTISKISHIHMEFTNMLIEDIMTCMGEKYKKVFVLGEKESQKDKLEFKRKGLGADQDAVRI